MLNPAKLSANQRNAQLSTGPRTFDGKAIARMNATNHGLRAASPTVPGECPEQWEAFRDAMLHDLAPAGVLEAELAERVALLTWRLRRVSAYESGVIARNSDRTVRRLRGEEDEDEIGGKERRTLALVRKQLDGVKASIEDGAALVGLFTTFTKSADNPRFAGADALLILRELADRAAPAVLDLDDEDDDDFDEDDDRSNPRHIDVDEAEFLRGIGVPDDFLDEPERWNGWTAGVIHTGLQQIGLTAGANVAKLLARALRETTDALAEDRAKLAGLKRELKAVEEATAIEEAEARKRAMVPGAETTEAVMRYEGHLQKQLMQTLNQLERVRAARSAFPPPPPLALDVTIGE